MKRYSLVLSALVISFGLFSCGTAPAPAPEAVPVPSAEPAQPAEAEGIPAPAAEPEPEVPAVQPAAAVPFDPSSITKEVFDSTKIDVQVLIERLNELIRAREYDAWVEYLGADYRDSVSDPAFLARISDSARLKNEKIVLRDLKDYFIHVVVPSRANDRVDDIEFIGQNRVKAFTVTARGQRLRLYDLEKTDGGWKIVN